jgi:hypothetical protein
MLDEPLQLLNHSTYEQFKFWWTSCFPRYRPGEAVASMWEAFPFGAILPDSDWAWWALDQVASEGVALAGQLNCKGIVIAQGLQGAAVLSWPQGPGSDPQVLMVAFRGADGVLPGAPTPVDPQRFLNAKGFSDRDRVIACAVFFKHYLVTASGHSADVQQKPTNSLHPA